MLIYELGCNKDTDSCTDDSKSYLCKRKPPRNKRIDTLCILGTVILRCHCDKGISVEIKIRKGADHIQVEYEI